MLSNEVMEKNKQDFISLLKSVNREGANVDGLIKKLDASGFFTAPASTKYNCAYEGGLVEHCLDVFYNMRRMAENKHLIEEGIVPYESIVITALLHDMYKMNFYEVYYQNKKVYSDYGSKKDDGGRFDWVAVKGYGVVDAKDRFLYGTNQETSEYMVRKYIPLTLEESVAIIRSNSSVVGTLDNGTPDIFNRYPLSVLLYLADVMSCYIDESTDREESN